MTKKVKKIPLGNYLGAAIVIALVVGIGLHYLLVSHAATPYSSSEAEAGTLTGSAIAQSSTGASGGSYVQFGSVAVTPPPTTTGVPLLGFSTGGGEDPQDMQDTALLGGRVPLAEFFLDGSSYNDSGWNMNDSLNAYVGYWDTAPYNSYRLIISMPTLAALANGTVGTLANCATGAYNSYYTQMGQSMVALGYPNSIVRLGWEFNGTWYGNQDANTDAPDWIKCFQDESSALKAADPKVLIDFNPTLGDPAYNGPTPFSWQSVYPGDQYVDIIGMDAYDENPAYAADNNNPVSTADEQAAWSNMVNGPDGLQAQVNFATAHHKLMSIPEWGLVSGGYNNQDGGDNPYYIQQMYDWITSHNYYYESYFNVDASDGNHYLSDFPNAEAEFKKLFTPLLSEAPNNVAPVK